MKNIGILGAGDMGKGMIKNLIKNNFTVYAYDPFSGALENAKELGAIPCNSPADLGKHSDIVLASLPTSETVENAVSGKDGALSTLKENTIICDMSTTDVALEKKLYSLAKEKGIGYLDCPVSGGPTGSNNGTLSIMVGGDKDVFEKANEVFNAIGENIFYIGESGSGQIVKICHNMILAVTTVALTESFITGVKSGMDPQKLADIYKVSVAKSGTLDLFGDNLINGNFDNTIFALSHMHKDINLYSKLTDDLQMPSIIANTTYQFFNAAMNQGLGPKDQSAVAIILEDLANQKIK